MNTSEISTHLTLLPRLNRKEVFDLLFSLGLHHKQFKQLLASLHTPYAHRKLLEYRPNVKLKEGTGSLVSRVGQLLLGSTVSMNTYEYHIVYTLVDSPYITKATRESLKDALDYSPVQHQASSDKEVNPCVVCGYPTSNGFCLSCIRKVHEFTLYRREAFVVPVNFLNFNIRQYINTSGIYEIPYNDWIISKRNQEVYFKLVQELPMGTPPIQYELPFIDYQKVIT